MYMCVRVFLQTLMNVEMLSVIKSVLTLMGPMSVAVMMATLLTVMDRLV